MMPRRTSAELRSSEGFLVFSFSTYYTCGRSAHMLCLICTIIR